MGAPPPVEGSGAESHGNGSAPFSTSAPASKARKLRVEKTDGSFFVVGGKIARVAYMLAKRPRGLTGWDCLPWMLRLDRRIDRLRDRYGVSIETRMEKHSDGNHARYILADKLKVRWL